MGHKKDRPAPSWARVYDPGAGRDHGREQRALEEDVREVLSRAALLRGQRITVTAGSEGLVTLTGSVATQALRREVELACWTRPAVRTLHDQLRIGRS